MFTLTRCVNFGGEAIEFAGEIEDAFVPIRRTKGGEDRI